MELDPEPIGLKGFMMYPPAPAAVSSSLISSSVTNLCTGVASLVLVLSALEQSRAFLQGL